MTQRFKGKTAIVTGASRGIGFAVAQRLVSEGARVCLTARKPEALDEAVTALGGPGNAIAVAGRADDVTHQAATVLRAVDEFGGLDLLVNNVGINPAYGPLMDLDLGAARKTFEVNCLATLSWVQQAHRAWMGEHGGAVVNVSSLSSTQPAPGMGFYGATKAMLNRITQQLATELGPGVRINAVLPGLVKTRFAEVLYRDNEDELVRPYPLKRLGVPEDVGDAVAFLLSEEASWLTGQLIVVDGGISLTGQG
ncbi:3-oxoacyl-ACP reductase [Streptomyces sp. alain-838]|nr:SDR family oxidoreductase [Streptomyces sp. alain-838]PAK25678.1 3-oxoacyl-ACP reductase [Streptomyces sp. alain-838]